jgi:hypothetical protein
LAEAEVLPSTADRALLRAYRAWGSAEFIRATERFSPAWRDRLRSAWASGSRLTSEVAWAELRREHLASARPDPSRVHPSWFVRALKSESLAVRLTVAAHGPPSMRQALCRGLEIDPSARVPDHLPDPEVLDWVLTFWSERLVGDIPNRDDDPPVIVAMTRFSPFKLARLIKVCGLVKHAFAMKGKLPSKHDEAIARFSLLDRVRIGYFRRHIGMADPRLGPLALADLEVIGKDRRRGHSRLGLVTFGRLLEVAEPHRARWAIQHMPYQVARGMRIRPTTAVPRKALAAWESWVLEAAWARLLAEGRLTGGRAALVELELGALR